ncbi:Rpn family recombination-promoting nuclease/putative transposase [Mycetohabitans endofungorum]|uniref:Rpn family recombination-promoting nuclease/putative transposase n=1 Tax=Mycetohabitans endofungorum TaxID=417203 RepID=UPI002B059211|nr:Rpn family recombination-promoting nuclease/putative transposase [Mycetohabitans endofungorum]
MKRSSTMMPHDALFKQFLTHPDTARDFLSLHLPTQWLAQCDLDTLRLESGSFVEDDLRAYYSDVLWSLQTRQGEGYVYALIEHQSRPERHMAFRLMRYAVAAMQRHLEAGHDQLPLVIPMLFYHGQVSPYPYSMRWLDSFEAPELASQLYAGGFPLVDVTVIPDDEILTHRRMAMLELLQKHIRQRDLATLVEQLASLLIAGYTTHEQLVSLMHYMLQWGDTTDPERFMRELAIRSPQHEEVLMTIAQKLEQKGEQKGLERGRMLGREEGREEGHKEAALKIARTLLASGLERETVKRMTDLSEADMKQICH